MRGFFYCGILFLYTHMGLFSNEPTSIVGVDLGASSVKLVELKPFRNQMQLITYAYSEGKIVVPNDEEGKLQLQAELLKYVAAKAKLTSKKAVASVPLSDVFSAIVRVPVVNKKDQAAIIQAEASKFLPFPYSEAVVDWKVIPSPKKVPTASSDVDNYVNQEKEQSVLITAAPKSTVNRIAEIFKRAGLQLQSLETEAFALTRSLIGNDPTSTLLVDIGAVRSNFFVVENSIPVMHRSMQLGGINFTAALDKVFGVGLDKAETMKADIMEAGAIEAGMSGFPKIFETTISPLINEIRYTMNLYTTQQRGTKPERIILTGGSARLPHLDDYLTKTFNLKVFVGDPWARVWYAEDLRPTLYEVGNRFAVAIGLALRDAVK